MSKEDCVEIIERIFDGSEDVVFPYEEGTQPITMLGSRDGYWLQAGYEPKEYDDAEDVLDALVSAFGVYEDILGDLEMIDPLSQSA